MAAARGRRSCKGKKMGGCGLASGEKTRKLTAWSEDFTRGLGKGWENDGWTPSIPIKNVCKPARTRTRPPRAERRSLFSSSHPLEISFLIRAPALMNICSSGTPTAGMSEFVFAQKFFLTPISQGTGGWGEEVAPVKETIYIFSRTRWRGGSRARHPSPCIASACLLNYVRLASQPGLGAPSNQHTICSVARVAPAVD